MPTVNIKEGLYLLCSDNSLKSFPLFFPYEGNFIRENMV